MQDTLLGTGMTTGGCRLSVRLKSGERRGLFVPGNSKKTCSLIALKHTRSVSHLDRITANPEICHGKPVVRGMRYPVEMILELLAGGMTTDEVLADYEDLTREDILACLEYAARVSKFSSIEGSLA